MPHRHQPQLIDQLTRRTGDILRHTDNPSNHQGNSRKMVSHHVIRRSTLSLTHAPKFKLWRLSVFVSAWWRCELELRQWLITVITFQEEDWLCLASVQTGVSQVSYNRRVHELVLGTQAASPAAVQSNIFCCRVSMASNKDNMFWLAATGNAMPTLAFGTRIQPLNGSKQTQDSIAAPA